MGFRKAANGQWTYFNRDGSNIHLVKIGQSSNTGLLVNRLTTESELIGKRVRIILEEEI